MSSNLAAEASGILNWALDGYQAWTTNGLKPPAEVTEATGSYRHENDLVGQFIDERCVQEPTAKCTNKLLHDGYEEWCRDNGHTPMAVNMLGKELRKKGFSSRKFQKGNGWTGIDLEPAFQKTDSDEMGLPRASSEPQSEAHRVVQKGSFGPRR